jgi:hypothetical protein
MYGATLDWICRYPASAIEGAIGPVMHALEANLAHAPVDQLRELRGARRERGIAGAEDEVHSDARFSGARAVPARRVRRR